MNVTNLARVNQKLAFARASLQAMRADSAANPLLQQAMAEACCFHLYAAYLAYLKEIGECYQVDEPERIGSVDDLVDRLGAIGKTPAESRELVLLSQGQGSWLYHLICAFHDCLAARQGPLGESNSSGSGGIPLVAVAETGDSRCTMANLSAWQQELGALIDRQRDSMTEY